MITIPVVSLNFTVFDGFARKPLFRIMTECDHHYIAEAVEGTGSNSVDMMVATLEMVKIRIGNHSWELDFFLYLLTVSLILTQTRH